MNTAYKHWDFIQKLHQGQMVETLGTLKYTAYVHTYIHTYIRTYIVLVVLVLPLPELAMWPPFRE